VVRCIDCVKLEKCAKTSGKPQIVEVVPGCEDGKMKPITNGDKIRGMTDEELAEWLFQAWHNSWYTLQEWLDWLRQEAQT